MRQVTESVKGIDYNYTPVTEEAGSLVFGDRNDSYGHPVEDFSKTAGFWSVYKGVAFTPEDVAQMMSLVKVSRQMFRTKRENPVDNVGYQECLQRIIEARAAGVPITDWSVIFPTPDMDYLQACAEEIERLAEIIPAGVSVEDLMACWHANHRQEEEEPNTPLCIRAAIRAKADGITFTPPQDNLFIFTTLLDQALRENWSVNTVNRALEDRGRMSQFDEDQWRAMTMFYAAETYDAQWRKVAGQAQKHDNECGCFPCYDRRTNGGNLTCVKER